jgi:hypothetical protein
MRASKLVPMLLALAGVACQAKPPGDLVGQYAISASLMKNSCGDAALPVADALEYRVQLRRDGRLAYWMIASPPGSQGVYAGGDVSFEREERFMLGDEEQPVDTELAELDPIALYGYDPYDPTAEPDDAESFCTLIVRESIEATVLLEDGDDADDDELALEGTNTIAMSATGDSDCRRVLKSAGGPFERLPCAAEYEISGTLLESEND